MNRIPSGAVGDVGGVAGAELAEGVGAGPGVGVGVGVGVDVEDGDAATLDVDGALVGAELASGWSDAALPPGLAIGPTASLAGPHAATVDDTARTARTSAEMFGAVSSTVAPSTGSRLPPRGAFFVRSARASEGVGFRA
jgi:hypothetical protein